MKTLCCTFILSASLGLTAIAEEATNADNSDRNTRDASGETLTPVDQSNNPGDVKITTDIRKMLVADDSLSMTAKNVKIITIDEVVTLRGPVETAEEKATVEKHAKMAGAKSITNQIEVKSQNP